MSVQERYISNYDQIARAHVAFWRETGNNPFQEEGILRHNEASTEHYIRVHAPNGYWLDAACGMGDLLMLFPERERVGIDISMEYLQIAQERGLTVFNTPIEETKLPSNCFELVTATDVLEHVLDLHAAVKELLRVLRPGGILIVRTPNEETLALDNGVYEYVHLRRFDQPTMQLLFGKVFDCEVIDTPVDRDIIHAVVRK